MKASKIDVVRFWVTDINQNSGETVLKIQLKEFPTINYQININFDVDNDRTTGVSVYNNYLEGTDYYIMVSDRDTPGSSLDVMKYNPDSSSRGGYGRAKYNVDIPNNTFAIEATVPGLNCGSRISITTYDTANWGPGSDWDLSLIHI